MFRSSVLIMNGWKFHKLSLHAEGMEEGSRSLENNVNRTYELLVYSALPSLSRIMYAGNKDGTVPGCFFTLSASSS